MEYDTCNPANPPAGRKNNDLRTTLSKVKNPLLTAVRVIQEVGSTPYVEMVQCLGLDYIDTITFSVKKDSKSGFEAKKRWLTKTFGLVLPDRGWGRGLDEHNRNKRVYEDAKVKGSRKGAWRVDCNFQDGCSEFMFRYWDRGSPKVIGEDTMSDALRKFNEKFNPDVVSLFDRCFQVEVDYDRLFKDSNYPIKRLKS